MGIVIPELLALTYCYVWSQSVFHWKIHTFASHKHCSV